MTATNKQSLHIIHFNDVYNIEEQSNYPHSGIARFYTAVNHCREKFGADKCLLLFSGDALSPSILSNITHGKHMVDLMNELKIDCSVVGNHDFDFGVDNFIEMSEMCNFPWINSNCLDNFTKTPLGECKKWFIIEKSSIKIGIVGLVEKDWVDTLSTVNPTDVTVEDFVDVSMKLSRYLREEKGCDMIIGLTHMRWPNDRLLASCCEADKSIDIILGGHDHNAGVEWVNKCLVVKSGTDFREFSLVQIDVIEKKVVIDNKSCVKKISITSDKFDANVRISKMVLTFTEDLANKLDQVIGKLYVDLDARFDSIRCRETNLGNFICDVILTAVEADCSLINSGALRSDKIISSGDFTMRELSLLLPIVDPVVVIEITGHHLIEALENGVSQIPKLEGRFPQVGGMKFSFHQTLPAGSRINVNSMTIQDTKIDLDAVYRLATTSYMIQGKDGYDILSNCKIILDDENGPCLNTAVQNFFQTIQVLSGFKCLRTKHYQKLLSRKNLRNLSIKESASDSSSKWNIIKQAINKLERDIYDLNPRIEGRITQI